MANGEMNELFGGLVKREDFSPWPYKDTEGNWTIGIGHKMNCPMTLETAKLILKKDLADAVSKFYRLPVEYRIHLSVPRKAVLVEMIFQIGLGIPGGKKGLYGFKKMLAALKEKDYERAAIEILDSLGAEQTPSRFRYYATKMLEGKEPDHELVNNIIHWWKNRGDSGEDS